MKRLHLGCGTHHIDGFVNIDVSFNPAVDVVDNARFLRGFEANSIELIYACNILEHLGRWEYKPALERWYEILEPMGTLRLSVPNFDALCQYYMKTGDLETIQCALYAGQDSPQNYHYYCWDFVNLRRDLESVGFNNVHGYNRNYTEHAHIRDWSLNYIPYKDSEGKMLSDKVWFKGTNIALNVEAVK